MITAMRIELVSDLPNGDDGKIFFLEGGKVSYEGTVATDLEAGVYKLTANKVQKLWFIHGVNGKLRFSVSLDGPDPWTLQYAAGLRLEISAPTFTGSRNEEMLDGIGADAYQSDASYIDRVTAGHYDVTTDTFIVDHEDGSVLELDYPSILSQVQGQGSGAATMYVYFRNLRNNKIYPRIFDANTTPNLASMVLETQAALPGAKALGKISRFLIDLVIARGQRGPAPTPRAGGGFRATPRGSAAAVRKFVGINGDPPSRS
jgi:hypothetical protein